MPPCLEELSVKTLPPNQSLMGLMRHGFGCENKHQEIYNARQGFGFGAGWAVDNI